MVEYNPVHTNQKPVKEKILQRIWGVVWALLCSPTPWFAHSWRRLWIRLFSKFGGGGRAYRILPVLCQSLGLTILGTLRLVVQV